MEKTDQLEAKVCPATGATHQVLEFLEVGSCSPFDVPLLWERVIHLCSSFSTGL